MPEEERVTTYSGLVRVLRERIASYVTESIERARALREAVRLADEPVEVEGRIWRGTPSGPPLWSSRTFQRQPRWEPHKRSRLPLKDCADRFVAHQSLSAPFDITLMRFRERTKR
jgi:hypothetical protein